jgi:TRAP-type C4-dicarboxylate transport system permease small subunit
MAGKQFLEKIRVARILARLYNSLVSIAAELGSTLIFLMALLITADVIMRYFFNVTTGIATETSGYALVAITFLGLAYAQKMGRNIRVEFIIKRLSPRSSEQLHITTLGLFSLFAIWFTYYTSGPVAYNYSHQTISPTVMHTPMWIPYLFVPLGAFILTLELIVELINKIRSYVDTYQGKAANKTRGSTALN